MTPEGLEPTLRPSTRLRHSQAIQQAHRCGQQYHVLFLRRLRRDAVAAVERVSGLFVCLFVCLFGIFLRGCVLLDEALDVLLLTDLILRIGCQDS